MGIGDAIRQKKLLSFTYDGYARVVEPHTYGRDKKGELMLRAFQIQGGSKSNDPFEWKVFCERDMRNVRVLDQHFTTPRPGYRRGDRLFTQILAEL